MSKSKQNEPNRRQFGSLALVAPLVMTAAGRALAQVNGTMGLPKQVPEIETRSLDEQHKAALAEGADLIVYGGGDIPNAQAANEQAFKARFPGMNIRILVDLSKYHDARIDNQLARATSSATRTSANPA